MWLIPALPSESSAHSPGAGSTTPPLASRSMLSDTGFGPWVTLSGKPQQRPRSWRGWNTRPWSALLFGAIASASWTPGLCGDPSICSSDRLPASPTAAPGSGSATMTGGATATETGRSCTSCGSSKSSAAAVPMDPPWSGSRMWASGGQADIFGRSVNDFASWVSTSRSRSLRLLAGLATCTSGSGGSSWATPNVCERGPESKESKEARGAGGIDLQTQAIMWATPDAAAANLGETSDSFEARRARLAALHGNSNGVGTPLGIQVQTWPTAAVADSRNTRNATAGRTPGGNHHSGETLVDAVENWPTAQATDDRATSGGRGVEKNPSLRTACMNWASPASPASRDEKGANGPDHMSAKDRPHEDQLPNQAVHLFARPTETTTDDGLASLLAVWTRPSCPRLSPAFQWWLMRWPHPRAIYCASGATEWIRWWSRMRSCVRGVLCSIEPEGSGGVAA